MITAFSAIVEAVIDTLTAAPAVCDVIYRARPNAVPDQADRALNVEWQGALPSEGAILGAPVDWSTKIVVELFARSTTESGDVAVDPLLKAVFERLAADMTLGQRVEHLGYPGIEAENTAEGKRTGWIRLTYIVQHRTSNLMLNP